MGSESVRMILNESLASLVVVDHDGVGDDDSGVFFVDFLRVYCIWSVFVGILFFLLVRCWRRAYIAQREKLSLEDADKITFVVTAQEVIANGGGYEDWKRQRRGSAGERSVFTISEESMSENGLSWDTASRRAAYCACVGPKHQKEALAGMRDARDVGVEEACVVEDDGACNAKQKAQNMPNSELCEPSRNAMVGAPRGMSSMVDWHLVCVSAHFFIFLSWWELNCNCVKGREQVVDGSPVEHCEHSGDVSDIFPGAAFVSADGGDKASA
eukprot:1865510-Rhodomonas_salina.2